jgi:hypothetical protein
MGRTELTWMNSSSSPSKQSTSQSSATARLAVSTGLSFSCAASAGSRMPCHSGAVSKLRVKMHRLPRNTKAPCQEPSSPVPSTCSSLLKAMSLKSRPRTSPVTSTACHTFWKVSALVYILCNGTVQKTFENVCRNHALLCVGIHLDLDQAQKQPLAERIHLVFAVSRAGHLAFRAGHLGRRQRRQQCGAFFVAAADLSRKMLVC